jgi:hypothetical protein
MFLKNDLMDFVHRIKHYIFSLTSEDFIDLTLDVLLESPEGDFKVTVHPSILDVFKRHPLQKGISFVLEYQETSLLVLIFTNQPIKDGPDFIIQDKRSDIIMEDDFYFDRVLTDLMIYYKVLKKKFHETRIHTLFEPVS